MLICFNIKYKFYHHIGEFVHGFVCSHVFLTLRSLQSYQIGSAQRAPARGGALSWRWSIRPDADVTICVKPTTAAAPTSTLSVWKQVSRHRTTPPDLLSRTQADRNWHSLSYSEHKNCWCCRLKIHSSDQLHNKKASILSTHCSLCTWPSLTWKNYN